MLKPVFKKKEIAGCIGCLLIGLSPSLVSFPCIPLYVAAMI